MARVLVLAGYAPSLLNFRGPLLQALRDRGHQVIASAPEPAPAVAERLGAMGVRYVPVRMARTGINPLLDLLYLVRLWWLMLRTRPDVVLAYTIKPICFGLLAARLAGVGRRFALVTGLGYAFMGNGEGRRGIVRKVATALYRLALRGAAGVFFQNPDDRADFEEQGILQPGAKACLVNGSGVDLALFRQRPIPSGGPVFLLIARLLRDKGIAEYVRAAEWVGARHPGARFMLVGGLDPNPAGISRAELDDWTARGLIDYRGELPDVREALAECTVFVLPSYYREGMPRTILEALATGRAIVTTDTPGCRETVVAGSNGCLVPARNADALAAAMLELASDSGKVAAMGQASRRMAEARFDVRLVNGVMLEAMGL